jgi:hypothetical protein
LLTALFTTIAQAKIGSVTEFSGSASIKRGKETIAVTKGTAIEQNDKIETKNGKLKIVFNDDTQVSVTEHSSLVIDDFVYDPKSGKGSLGMKATSGTVRYVSGAIAKDPKQVKINTPTAAIAVRGTDFVMSVNEIGSSMIILMPTCDWESSTIKGLVCGSGAIDVESGPNQISMTRPFQATIVESAGQPPTPPITVNLFNTPVGNNLQVTPPRTAAGASVVAAARAAAAATGVTRENKKQNKEDKEDKEDKDDAKEERQHAANKEGGSVRSSKQGRSANEGDENTENRTKIGLDTPGNKDAVTNEVVAASETENPYVKKLWKDKSETQQIGWQYESLSPNSRNYASVVMPINTQVLVVVTQDMQTNSWNFSSGKPTGQIVINQNYR